MTKNPTPANIRHDLSDRLALRTMRVRNAIAYAEGRGKYRDLRRTGDLMGSRFFLMEKYGTDVAEAALRELGHA